MILLLYIQRLNSRQWHEKFSLDCVQKLCLEIIRRIPFIEVLCWVGCCLSIGWPTSEWDRYSTHLLQQSVSTSSGRRRERVARLMMYSSIIPVLSSPIRCTPLPVLLDVPFFYQNRRPINLLVTHLQSWCSMLDSRITNRSASIILTERTVCSSWA